MSTARRILVLYRHPEPARMLAAVKSHLHALDGRGHDVRYVNTAEVAKPSLRLLRWDAVILHTTFLTMRWHNEFSIWKYEFDWLAELAVPKIAVPQDEYDHSHVLDDWLYELNVSVIFTNFDPKRRRDLYPLMADRVPFEQCLTGYVDQSAAAHMSSVLALEDRQIDVGYRARRLPYSFGSHGQLKHRIGVEAQRIGHELGLRTDISTDSEATIVGKSWFNFLASARTTVGAESGSSVLDRRGEIQSSIRRYLERHPQAPFAQVSANMPVGWDDYDFAALGPRHFEAILTRTPQVLVEGHYDGALEPGRHYIPVRRDFSNLSEALESTRDLRSMQAMADVAFREVVSNSRYGYGVYARQLEQWLGLQPARTRLLQDVVQGAAVVADDAVRDVGRLIPAVLIPTLRLPELPKVRATVWARSAQLIGQGRYAALSTAAGLRLVARTAEVRQLIRRAAEIRAPIRPHLLLHEILDLNTIRKAHHVAADPFITSPVLLRDKLVLMSGPTGETSVATWTLALDAVRRGCVREISWRRVEGDTKVLVQLGILAKQIPCETARALAFFTAPQIGSTAASTKKTQR